MNALSHPFQKTPIDNQTRDEIIHRLWPRRRSEKVPPEDLDLDGYFTYYTKQCSHALHDRGRHVMSRTHQDIVDIVKLLEDLSTKNAIKSALRTKVTSLNVSKENEEEMLDNSIDLAARLLVMMDIGVFQFSYSGRPELVWKEGSLKCFVTDYFGQPQVLGYENIKLEKSFTAQNLGRIAGIEIEWTDNLADHLRMIDEDKRLGIFRHASFLKWQQRHVEDGRSPSIPPDV
jgi:hypothetical protein